MAAWDPASGAIGKTDVSTVSGTRTRSNSGFVPELWSDEIIAAYKANLVMPQLVTTMSHVGKKGDTVHIPAPTRGSATAKAENTVVTLILNNELKKQFLIDKHFEYSRLIEDLVGIQALDTLRQFYTDDAGYALAKTVDDYLHDLGSGFAATDAAPTVAGTAGYVSGTKARVGDNSAVWNPSANSNAGNAVALTDAGIRAFIQALDDNDVPSVRRAMVIPPVEKRKLLGIPRYTEQAFIGESAMGNSIRNGLVGDLYGVPLYVSTRAKTVADTGTATDQRAVLLFQREGLLLVEQMNPRTQTQYKQEWLADLFTADLLFGGGVLRPEAGVAIVVPSA
jgi:hypothetical protein